MKGLIHTNKNIVNTFIFIAGAAVGSVVTWQITKKKYERIAQEEIDSVKATYSKLHDYADDSDVEETVTDETPVYDEEDYAEYDALTTVYGGENVPNMGHDKPYVIPPEEFGENEDYDQFSLTLYADNILTDENDCIVEDVESIVGVESLTHFGEFEDDSVFVRNDRLKIDYEILLNTRKYSDVLNTKPYLAEDE